MHLQISRQLNFSFQEDIIVHKIADSFHCHFSVFQYSYQLLVLFVSVSGAIIILVWHNLFLNRAESQVSNSFPFHSLANEIKYGSSVCKICYCPVREGKQSKVAANC